MTIPRNSFVFFELAIRDLAPGPGGHINVIRYLGEPGTQKNVKRQRANNLNALRKYGTPVVIKHMYNDDDVDNGIAEPSPNFNNIYKQTRNDDPLSFGVGYVSVEKSEDEWINPNDGSIVKSDVSPGLGFVPAPKYRGYGPGYLTYAFLPDVAEDMFKLTETGVFIKTQTAQAQIGWFPEVNDNDMLTIVQIDRTERVIATRERFILKMTNPISLRGTDRYGQVEYSEDFGNRFVTDQNFEMTRVPLNDIKMKVDMDR